MGFKNKVVIVTGASSGIGAATAVAFSNHGAKVVMVGRNEVKLTKVASKCSHPLIILADVSKDEDVKRIISETIKNFGQIDVLVNNAGLSRNGGLLESKELMKAYDTIMNINVRSLVYLTSLAAPYLAKTKGRCFKQLLMVSFLTELKVSSSGKSVPIRNHRKRHTFPRFSQSNKFVGTRV